jgi:hypothetical protein
MVRTLCLVIHERWVPLELIVRRPGWLHHPYTEAIFKRLRRRPQSGDPTRARLHYNLQCR